MTLAGTGNAPVLLLVRLTVAPPPGAGPLSSTVTVLTSPETTTAGSMETVVTTGGSTVTVADMFVPVGSVAVMLTSTVVATGDVATRKSPLVAPPAMVKPAGTNAAGLLVIKLTVKPAGGAGPLKTKVPTKFMPPVTELGFSVSERTLAGLTVNMPFTLLAPSVAVTVTIVAVVTPTVVAVNVCDVPCAGIKTLAGTVTAGLELLK